ncbi:hypothetical protein F5883DRAFT_653135 [Diaporthe sp. PMI_573]|nr:hypothetical protein F5883DRAFT_653135 [Diaporthaceae sp. PMI_573]
MKVMAIAISSPDNLTSAAVTITVTEPVCTNSRAGEPTPLSVASALATAADASAASLIANLTAYVHYEDAAAPQYALNTTTATTVASATNCPAPPTFDLSPVLFSSIFNGDLSNTTVEDIDANGTQPLGQRWSKGRQSLCFTSSSWVGTGYYAIYLDGWGQETAGCGRGALDNIRGQCNDVQNWECIFWGTGVLLTFYLSGAPRSKCAVNAMWLASPKGHREEGLCCVYLGSPIGRMNTC